MQYNVILGFGMSLRLSLLRQSVTMHQDTKSPSVTATDHTSCLKWPAVIFEIVLRGKVEGFYTSSTKTLTHTAS
jgi:hypothetical protein